MSGAASDGLAPRPLSNNPKSSMAVDNSGARKVRGFIVYSIG
jgi:hypothetical protein